MNDLMNKEVYQDIAASTNLITGEDFRSIVFNISKYAADMVVKTLGPYGATTIIDDSTFTYPTKDGWTCLNKMHFNDPIYDTIFKTLKQISFSIVNKVGDGTTSALIGANAFLEEILVYQEDNEFRQVDFMNDLNTIRDKVIDRLLASDELHIIDKEGDYSDIRKVAYISSNSNDKISDMIQKIYQETQNPNIYVTIDPGSELTYEVLTGYRFECSVLNHKAYINEDNGTCKMNNGNTLIAIFNHNITYNEHAELITAMSRYAQANNKSIIIAAPYFDDIITNVIGTSINQMLQQNQIPNIMMMQVPLSKEIHQKYMSDLIMLTNAQVFDVGKVRAFYAMIHNDEHPDETVEEKLLKTPDYHFETPTDLIAACLGKINAITIDKTYAVLQDYINIVNPTIYKNTLAEVEREYNTLKSKANKSDTMLNKDFMDVNQRYVKLIGKMGTIKIGGSSELEKHCLKDSVDDAVLACRSAYDHGYIRGLNLATISIIRDMMEKEENPLSKNILEMLNNVFLSMTNSVMVNKYPNTVKRRVKLTNSDHTEQSLSINLCNEEIVEYCVLNKLGYNLVTESFDSMDNLTVINSVSTDIEILKAIIGTLSLMLTSSQFLSTNRVYNKKMTRNQILTQKMEDNVKMVDAVTNAVMNRIGQNASILTKIKKVFSGK